MIIITDKFTKNKKSKEENIKMKKIYSGIALASLVGLYLTAAAVDSGAVTYTKAIALMIVFAVAGVVSAKFFWEYRDKI